MHLGSGPFHSSSTVTPLVVGAVLDALRYDVRVAGREDNRVDVAKVNRELAGDDHEELVEIEAYALISD